MDRGRQAANLMSYQQQGFCRVIAVASGKGGVGKTNVAANLSIALSGLNRDVMLLDADLSLANIDVLLDLQPKFNLSHVVNGDVDLESTIIDGPGGIRIVPASSGNFSMTDLPNTLHASLINSFAELSRQPDILIVDTAAGIADNVARYVQAAQEAIVVVCDDPSSITDAYALIKVFSRHYGVGKFHVVTNQTKNQFEGRQLFAKIQRVSDLYLDVVLRHLGNVPSDDYLRHAVQEQRAVVSAYPNSVSGKAFTDIAKKIDRLKICEDRSGGIQFFFERLMKNGNVVKGMHL